MGRKAISRFYSAHAWIHGNGPENAGNEEAWAQSRSNIMTRAQNRIRSHQSHRGLFNPSIRVWFLALLGLPAICACSDSSGGDTEGPLGGSASAEVPIELVVAREKAAAHFVENNLQAAAAAIRPFAERPDAEFEDLLTLGILEFANSRIESAGTWLEAAASANPKSAAAQFNLGKLKAGNGYFEEAELHLRKAHELSPDDYPTHLALANVLDELGEEEEALGHYRDLVAVGVDRAGSWHLSTLFRIAQLLSRQGSDEAVKYFDERDVLIARGMKAPSSVEMQRGNFGLLGRALPAGNTVPTPTPLFPAKAGMALPSEFSNAVGIVACSLVENWEIFRNANGDAVDSKVGLPDLLCFGPDGIFVARKQSGLYRVEQVDKGGETQAWSHVVPCDLDNDGDLDLVAASQAKVVVFHQSATGFERASLSLPELTGVVRDLVAVDFDHEGDLDLLLAGDFGARLWRNDGLVTGIEKGQFSDASAEADLPDDRAFDWCAVEDFDTDQDVDLLFGGSSGYYLADSLRGGQFSDESLRLEGIPASKAKPILADFDGDTRPDMWVPEAGVLAWGRPSGDFKGEGRDASTGVLAADLDLDGSFDVLNAPSDVHYAFGLESELTSTWKLFDAAEQFSSAQFLAGDLDGDAHMDVLAHGTGSATLRSGTSGGNSIRLALKAEKDNRRGVGSIVEVRAGGVYRRIFWDGEPQTIGVGSASKLDVIRVTWPTGVIQHELDVPVGSEVLIERVERQSGSCPFLYTWNGETYEFITDVLGITPLGLPMEPGVLVPPDHDEYVLVRGDQMKLREGEHGERFFDVQITEELREVTYLDRVRLDVIDHPLGTEIHPNERFCFPPFPEAHTHVVDTPLAPLSAIGSDGKAWTKELAAEDGDYAIPFDVLERQFMGLAKPHWIELAFDSDAIRGAEQLRLICSGWFYWTNASVNVAAARTPGVDFIPPIFQVPDADSPTGWRDAGPPVGFPAGKLKSMVIDVTQMLDPADPRLRIFSTLRLYWDSIRLAVDGDDGRARVTSLEPTSGDLYLRGFSQPTVLLGEHELEWFDWDQKSSIPRWNQHPGLYTKLGDVLPLLTSAEDRFVIMGAGDALRVRFDAAGLGPVPDGMQRDYLLYMDGWAKDRDPNSVEALFVEPLPFHGMSSYPYGEDEAFPADEAHRAWRLEWNTRPSHTWIEPLHTLGGRSQRDSAFASVQAVEAGSVQVQTARR